MDNIDRLVRGLDNERSYWWQTYCNPADIASLAQMALGDMGLNDTQDGFATKPCDPERAARKLHSMKRSAAMELYVVLRAAHSEGLILPGPNEKA